MLLCFGRSVGTKSASFSSQTGIARPRLIDVSSKKYPYYLLAASFNMYVGSFDTIDDPYAQIKYKRKSF